jgi:hypothetical protein
VAHLLIALAVIVGFIWALVAFPSFRVVVGILVALGAGGLIVLNERATREQKESEAAKAQEEQQRQVKYEADKKDYCEAQQKRKMIEEKQWTVVPASQIEIRDPSLTQAQQSYGAPNDDYRFTASAKNKSKSKVVGLRMNVTALDCPTQDTRNASCEIVGRSDGTFITDIPAGEVRRIDGKFNLRNLPRARGVIMPRFAISAVRVPTDQDDRPIDGLMPTVIAGLNADEIDTLRYGYKCN